MKRVLICLSDFRQGGIPRCLQTLLMNINTSRYDVDVICLSQKGPYKGKIPNCRVLKEDYVISNLLVHTSKINKHNFIRFLPSILLKLLRYIGIKLFSADLLVIRLGKLAKKSKTL